MNKLKYFIFIFLVLAITPVNLDSKTSNYSESKDKTNIEVKTLDSRAKILSDYFASYNSPFEYQAQDFIEAADQYGIDWKLVPAISGVESTFGKQTYGYNAWGWGIYGDNRLNFTSWKDGIYTVTAGLKENYIDKGLTNPYSINKVYAASPYWGWKVDFFMKDLEKFNQLSLKGV